MIVPPTWRIPEISFQPRGFRFPSTIPRQPFSTPTVSWPSSHNRRHTARITAFSPGQSPPPVSIPTRIGRRVWPRAARAVERSVGLLPGHTRRSVFWDILEIVFLGLASALWPLLLVVVVIALNTSRPVRILGWFLVGGLLTTISIDTALVFAFQGSSFMEGPKPAADGWVDIVIGLLALLAALVLQWGMQGKGPKRFQPKPK